MSNEEVGPSEDVSGDEIENSEAIDNVVEESSEPIGEQRASNPPREEEEEGYRPGDANGNTLDAPDPFVQAYSATMDSITGGHRSSQSRDGQRRGRGRGSSNERGGGGANGNQKDGNRQGRPGGGNSAGGRNKRGILPPDDPYWQFGMPVEYWGLSVGKAGQYAEGNGNQNTSGSRTRSGGPKGASNRGGPREGGDPQKKKRRRRRRGRKGPESGAEKAGAEKNTSPDTSSSAPKDSE